MTTGLLHLPTVFIVLFHLIAAVAVGENASSDMEILIGLAAIVVSVVMSAVAWETIVGIYVHTSRQVSLLEDVVDSLRDLIDLGQPETAPQASQQRKQRAFQKKLADAQEQAAMRWLDDG